MEQAKSSTTRDVFNTCKTSWEQPQDSTLCMTGGPTGGQKPEDNSGIAFSRHTHRTLGEPSAKHNTNTKESEHLTRMSTVRIQTRLSRSRSRYHQNLSSLRKRSVNPTKPHIVLFVPGARFASGQETRRKTHETAGRHRAHSSI